MNLVERINYLSAKVDSGRFKMSEKNELDRLVNEYIKLEAFPFLKIQAEIKFNQIYVCDKCHQSGYGITRTIEFKGTSSQDLKDTLDSLDKPAHYMPIGWASFYSPSRTKFLCEDCK